AKLGWKDYDQRRIRVYQRISGPEGNFVGNSVTTQRFVQDTTAWEIGTRATFNTGPFSHVFVIAYSGFYTQFDFAGGSLPISYESNIFNPIRVARPDIPEEIFSLDRSENSLASFFVLEQTNSGISFIDTIKAFDDRLVLVVGARRQGFEVPAFNYDEEAWTPISSIVGKINDNFSLYATYSEAFQQGPTAPLQGVANPGEIFSPFTTESFEGGVKFDIGRVGGSLAAFQTELPAARTNPETNIFEIVGGELYRGLEFIAFGEPTPGLNLISGIVLLDTELQNTGNAALDGNFTTATSDVLASFSAEYDIEAIPGFTVRSTVIHTGRQFLDQANEQRIPSSTRVDLGARYSFDIGDTRMITRFDIQNVSDLDYWSSAGQTPGREWLARGEPRTFLFSASVLF
ncbi:MAG: TonB-dependent receptor, partial [Pseudomonadota bacterium]